MQNRCSHLLFGPDAAERERRRGMRGGRGALGGQRGGERICGERRRRVSLARLHQSRHLPGGRVDRTDQLVQLSGQLERLPLRVPQCVCVDRQLAVDELRVCRCDSSPGGVRGNSESAVRPDLYGVARTAVAGAVRPANFGADHVWREPVQWLVQQQRRWLERAAAGGGYRRPGFDSDVRRPCRARCAVFVDRFCSGVQQHRVRRGRFVRNHRRRVVPDGRACPESARSIVASVRRGVGRSTCVHPRLILDFKERDDSRPGPRAAG